MPVAQYRVLLKMKRKMLNNSGKLARHFELKQIDTSIWWRMRHPHLHLSLSSARFCKVWVRARARPRLSSDERRHRRLVRRARALTHPFPSTTSSPQRQPTRLAAAAAAAVRRDARCWRRKRKGVAIRWELKSDRVSWPRCTGITSGYIKGGGAIALPRSPHSRISLGRGFCKYLLE